MERIVWRAGIGAVVLIIGTVAALWNKGSASEDFRTQAHKLVARVPEYSQKPDYYDYLVDEAHDRVFDESYHMEYSRRRGDTSWVDNEQYEHDLFASMIEQATSDHATSVVEALMKYRTARGDPAPAQIR